MKYQLLNKHIVFVNEHQLFILLNKHIVFVNEVPTVYFVEQTYIVFVNEVPTVYFVEQTYFPRNFDNSAFL